MHPLPLGPRAGGPPARSWHKDFISAGNSDQRGREAEGPFYPAAYHLSLHLPIHHICHTFACVWPSTWHALITLTHLPLLYSTHLLPQRFKITSSREPALILSPKANSPRLSLNLTYPFLSLHISYFCTCHLKFWLL